jgi:hypothetical protein
MLRVVLTVAGLISTLLAASEASAQTGVPRNPSALAIYGSYYEAPYNNSFIPMNPWSGIYRGGFQPMPWGGQIYSGGYHPQFLGYRGRYSPSPALPSRHKH